jgi:hypothetical protein
MSLKEEITTAKEEIHIAIKNDMMSIRNIEIKIDFIDSRIKKLPINIMNYTNHLVEIKTKDKCNSCHRTAQYIVAGTMVPMCWYHSQTQ